MKDETALVPEEYLLNMSLFFYEQECIVSCSVPFPGFIPPVLPLPC